MHPDSDTLVKADTPLETFSALTVDEKLNTLFTMVSAVLESQVYAQGVISEVSSQVSPVMEQMMSHPMFKMMGLGKRRDG